MAFFREIIKICYTNSDTMFLGTCRITLDIMLIFFFFSKTLYELIQHTLLCVVSRVFGDKITEGLWPPRSPNLNFGDCDLPSALNDKLHNNNLQTEDVKRSVQDVLSSVAPAELLRTVNNVSVKCDACVEAERNQFQHLL